MRAELAPYAVDPFGPSANPSAYVACEASERARGILEHSLDEGRVAALMGPPGHGKTLLLHLLGGREEDRARVAYVPFCTLAFDELCTVVLNAIGVARQGPARDALAAVTRELAPRGGVVILVDDAHAMSEACAAALAALYEELGGALRIALAAVQGPAAQRVFGAFGSRIDVVLLAGGMSGRESRRYVEMRLAYGGARPEIVAAFDEATIDALHRASQGVPRRLNQAAEDIVRRATRSDLPRLRQVAAGVVAKPAAAPRATPATPEIAPPPKPPEIARALERAERAPTAPVPRRIEAPAPPAPVPQRSEAPAPPAPAPTPERRVSRPAAAPVVPERRRAPQRPPMVPRSPRPGPAPDSEDDRGILLPEIFGRDAGEPSGEYRIVRGTAVPSTPPRGAAPATPRRPGVPESVLVARAPEPTAERRREIPMPSAYADRVPRPGRQSAIPIRAIGVAGFALGVAISMTWIVGSEPDVPRMVEENENPPSAVNPPAKRAQKRKPAPAAPVAPPARAPSEPAAPIAREVPAPAPAAPPAPAVSRAPEAAAARVRVLVSINATPWAVVRVDGREVGETPLAGISLEAGRHVFEARMPDGTTREQTVEISAQRRAVVFR
jgi:type II secretory pathway predicted ATPase ExeA